MTVEVHKDVKSVTDSKNDHKHLITEYDIDDITGSAHRFVVRIACKKCVYYHF